MTGEPHLLLHQAPDVFAFWEAWEKESGRVQDVPYWITIWPAAGFLCEYLANHPEKIHGRSVLDLGCGGGAVALTAAKFGAAGVVANDIDPLAIWMTQTNAEANNLTLTTSLENLIAGPPSPGFDLILVGDLFYDKSVSIAMLSWLREARNQGSEIWICDASRPFAPKEKIQLLQEATLLTNSDLDGKSSRLTRLFAYLG